MNNQPYAGSSPPNADPSSIDTLPPESGLPSLHAGSVPRSTWFWLAGIVVALLAMATMVFGFGMKDDEPESGANLPQQQVVVPSTPDDLFSDQPPGVEQEVTSDLSAQPVPQPSNAYIPPPVYYQDPPAPAPMPAMEPMPQPLSLRERRMGMTENEQAAAQANGSLDERYLQMMASAAGGNAQPAPAPQGEAPNSIQVLGNLENLVIQGTYLQCTLETKIVSSIDGPVACVLNRPVYSYKGSKMLLPRGTRVLGQYKSGEIQRNRVAIVWSRLVTPAGISVALQSPAIDGEGSVGAPGKRNSHWGSRISSAIMLSMLSDVFKYFGAKDGPQMSSSFPGTGTIVNQPFESNTAQTVQQLAELAAQEGGQMRPTVTLQSGMVLNVYVNRDLDFGSVMSRR